MPEYDDSIPVNFQIPTHRDCGQLVWVVRVPHPRTGAYVNKYICGRCRCVIDTPVWITIRELDQVRNHGIRLGGNG